MFKNYVPLALSLMIASGSILLIWLIPTFSNSMVPEMAFGFALTFLFAMSLSVLIHHLGYKSGLREGREDGELLPAYELHQNSYYILHMESTREAGVKVLFLTQYDPTCRGNFAYYKVRFDRFRDRDWRISSDNNTFDRIDVLEETARDRKSFLDETIRDKAF